MSARVETGTPPLGRPLPLATIRRAALWGLLAAKVLGGWGLGWDIRWHMLIGRDSFWIAPHVLTYAGVALGAVLSLGVLLLETWYRRGRRVRRDGAPAVTDESGTIRLAGLVGTRGFHLAWWGAALTILAAPFDDLWHRLFGIDVTLWSPPHLLGLAGAQVNTLGCLVIALEAWPAGRPARALTALSAGALLLGIFQVTADPAIQTAFLRGGAFFFTWAVLSGLAITAVLVLAACLTGWRSAPLVVAVGAVLFHLSVIAISDVGFALTKPTPAIEEAIASDPTSPIAIAHEMARRSGTPPGRRQALRLFPLLPAALMVVIDARRRWALASFGFGALLTLVSSVGLARSPALAHALPGMLDTAVAVPLALAAAVAGGWCGTVLAGALLAPTPGQ